MPTYEYRCADCRHELEAQQSFTDEPLRECPSCGGTLKKKFSSVGISFKGSGFYKTDSRTSSTGSSTKKDTAAAESSSSTDASSSSSDSSKDGGSKDTGSKSAESKSSDGGSKTATAASA